MPVAIGGWPDWLITTSIFIIEAGTTNTDVDALSQIQWPEVLSDPDVEDFDETIGTQSIKAICNSSRISYGYCETICSGAASLSSQFVDMSVSPSQPFDWIKEQSKNPEFREVVNLIKRHKLNSRKIKKGDSSVTKALLRMKGQLKLIKGVLYRKPFWTIVLKESLDFNSFCSSI